MITDLTGSVSVLSLDAKYTMTEIRAIRLFLQWTSTILKRINRNSIKTPQQISTVSSSSTIRLDLTSVQYRRLASVSPLFILIHHQDSFSRNLVRLKRPKIHRDITNVQVIDLYSSVVNVQVLLLLLFIILFSSDTLGAPAIWRGTCLFLSTSEEYFMSQDVTSALSCSFQRCTTESSASRSVTKSTSINIQLRSLSDQSNTRTSCHVNDITGTKIPGRFRLDMTFCTPVNSCILSHTDARLDVLTLQVLVWIYPTSTHWNDDFPWTSVTDPNTDEGRPTEWSLLLKAIVSISSLDWKKRTRDVLLLRRQGNYHQCIFPNVSFISLFDFNWSIVRRLFTEIDTRWVPR